MPASAAQSRVRVRVRLLIRTWADSFATSRLGVALFVLVVRAETRAMGEFEPARGDPPDIEKYQGEGTLEEAASVTREYLAARSTR